jgi:hypothetical protein
MTGYISFVVRIWVDTEKGVLRGLVQHVSTGESVRFASLDKLVQFIDARLTLTKDPPSSDQAVSGSGEEK